MTDSDERYRRGLAKLGEIDEKAAQRLIDSLADIAPDFARYVVEFPFGDIFSRPGLDLRTRELITVAALTAMGHASPQLKAHIQLALGAGCKREEIVETIMQMAMDCFWRRKFSVGRTAKALEMKRAEPGKVTRGFLGDPSSLRSVGTTSKGNDEGQTASTKLGIATRTFCAWSERSGKHWHEDVAWEATRRSLGETKRGPSSLRSVGMTSKNKGKDVLYNVPYSPAMRLLLACDRLGLGLTWA